MTEKNHIKIYATEKIDAVLIYLNENREKAYHYGYGLPRIYPKPKNKIVLSDQDLLNVLHKLELDKMVRVEKMGIGSGNTNSAKHYSITIDGEVLLQDGGYTQQMIDERITKDNLKQNLLTSQRNERVVKRASVFAAVGAIGVLIVEIYNSLC